MPGIAVPSLIGVKVLVVEDDEATRYAWSRQLARTGATVITAEDAEHALTVLQAEAIDVLLTDLALPGMNGLQLFTSMSSRAFLAIAVTAFSDTAERERALEAGFKAYLVKPVDPLALVTVIAQHVGSR